MAYIHIMNVRLFFCKASRRVDYSQLKSYNKIKKTNNKMTKSEYNFILQEKIQTVRNHAIAKDFERTSYVSFSGGKDSTVLVKILEMALPKNTIPKVFCDTGLEYLLIKKYILDMMEHDPSYQIIKPQAPITSILKKYGYPFKSKEFSQKVHQYQKHGTNSETVKKYLGITGEKSRQHQCPKILLPIFSQSNELKISDKCCLFLKKKPFIQYTKDTGRNISMLGMRRAENGLRQNLNCFTYDTRYNITHYNAIADLSDEFIEMFIQEEQVKLAPLYLPPYNFTRTGCVGCPYAMNIQAQLETLKANLPQEYRKANALWGAVYEKYKSLNYRIKEDTEKNQNLLPFF